MATEPGPPAREITATMGEVLDGRYRITAFIGDGGMGSVYRAEHVTIRKPVAVKLLHRKLASQPGFSERFEREAMTAGRIDHPNCVHVSDFGKLDSGTLFLVMELVEGRTLSELLAETGPLPIPRALHITAHALRGLAHAHAAGIVHRDIKPDNIILVDRDGDRDFAKLLDFGIAKMIGQAALDSGDPQLTQVGTTVGTPKYMPPEQAFGKDIDGRSDLYSLTIVLFIMLTGRAPFEADEIIDLLMMHASRPPPRLEDMVPELGGYPELEGLIRCGLAKKPSERFADAETYLRAVDDALHAYHDRGARPPRAPTSPTMASPSATPPPERLLALAPTGYATPVPGSWAHQRDTQPWWRQKRVVIAGGVVGLIAVIALAASSGSAPEPGAPPGSSPLALIERSANALGAGPSKTALKARELNAAGRYREAEALTASAELDPPARMERARALVGLGRAADGVREYAKAARAVPVLGADPAALELAREQMHAKDDAALAAVEILIRHDRDAKAVERLVELAGHPRSLELRHLARKLATELDLLSAVDRVASYSLDLNQGKTCEDRREALLELGKLEDARAAPAIKRARYRMRGGVLGIGDKNTNHCLKADADRILAELSLE